MPMGVLYLVSDGLRFLMSTVLKYRSIVIDTNLSHSFPNKTQGERNQIKEEFYAYFCDLAVETIKLITISEKELKRRCSFEDLSLLDELYKQDKNIIMVLGHYGNWEWAGPVLSMVSPYQQCIVYHTLRNPYFDRLFLRMRSKHGSYMMPMENAFREILRKQKETKIAVTLVSDQSPNPKTAYWTKFLNQDTAVFMGTEKIAGKLDMPIVFTSIVRERRGKYVIKTRLLEFDSSIEGDITRAHTQALEEDIIEHPSTWLWSHRRWKHKRPTN